MRLKRQNALITPGQPAGSQNPVWRICVVCRLEAETFRTEPDNCRQQTMRRIIQYKQSVFYSEVKSK